MTVLSALPAPRAPPTRVRVGASLRAVASARWTLGVSAMRRRRPNMRVRNGAPDSSKDLMESASDPPASFDRDLAPRLER